MDSAELRLIAYETVPREGYELIAAPHDREWMDASPHRSAYRCLPMLIANQAGWQILNPATVRAKWNGGAGLNAIDIEVAVAEVVASAKPDYLFPSSHFGVGILTWTLPFLFRTPPGYNLLVRGPANTLKDGIAPLEGIVETDWTPATFTMNWKLTRTDTWVTFLKGEPLAMIVPQRRGELEHFTPQILPLSDDAELEASNAAWCASRDQFNENFAAGATTGWEKHYFHGAAPDGSAAPQHQTRLRLQAFQ